ncbi:MAG: T9SS type A sorting domain-containing protein [Bacteroidota bacterium]
MSISDIRGKVVKNQSFFNSQKINLSITESPGIYIFNIISDGKKAVIKVIKITQFLYP